MLTQSQKPVSPSPAAVPLDPTALVGQLRTLTPEKASERTLGLAPELAAAAAATPFAEAAQVAAAGGAEEALALGRRMLAEDRRFPGRGLHSFGLCWLLVSAARGSEPAEYLVDYLMKDDWTFRIPEHPDALRTAPSVLRSPVIEQEPQEEPDPAVPGRVILRTIGDPQSREGQDLSRRFAHVVGRVLPYAGALPEPGAVAARLRDGWPWAERVAKFAEGYAAMLRQGGSDVVRIPPLLLVGKTGSGKTSIATELANIFGLPSQVVSCGGVSDSGGLASTSRGWSTSRPCAPFLAAAQFRAANPMIVLDELDKGTEARSQNGSVWAASLGMLEKGERYHDTSLMAEVDLSGMSFIATANDASVLPAELRDRFTVIQVPQPRPEDFGIIVRHALGDIARLAGLPVLALPDLDGEDIAFLQEMFAQRRHSLRSFHKIVSMLLADKASAIEQGKAPPKLLN